MKPSQKYASPAGAKLLSPCRKAWERLKTHASPVGKKYQTYANPEEKTCQTYASPEGAKLLRPGREAWEKLKTHASPVGATPWKPGARRGKIIEPMP